MQTSRIDTMYCECGKETSKKLFYKSTQISIHFTNKSTYWHIYDFNSGKIKRVFSKPQGWK